jgi:hypothetical protein
LLARTKKLNLLLFASRFLEPIRGNDLELPNGRYLFFSQTQGGLVFIAVGEALYLTITWAWCRERLMTE